MTASAAFVSPVSATVAPVGDLVEQRDDSGDECDGAEDDEERGHESSFLASTTAKTIKAAQNPAPSINRSGETL